MKFPGVFVAEKDDKDALDEANKAMREWTAQAARGETGWICCDCGASFPDGMPDACPHGDSRCTEIIQRDKTDARKS